MYYEAFYESYLHEEELTCFTVGSLATPYIFSFTASFRLDKQNAPLEHYKEAVKKGELMIHHISEGMSCRQGLNWRRSSDTSLGLILKLWRFSWYLRIRAEKLCQAPDNCKRFIFTFGYVNIDSDSYEQLFGGLYYNWGKRMFKYGNCTVTEELLADFIETVGTPSGTGIDYITKLRRVL